MRLYRLAISITVFCGFLAGAQAQTPRSVSVSTSIQMTSEALAAQPVGANWLSYNGDYTGRRRSNSAIEAKIPNTSLPFGVEVSTP